MPTTKFAQSFLFHSLTEGVLNSHGYIFKTNIDSSVSLIPLGAAAQSSDLITGDVVASYSSGGAYIIELNQQNSCGSSKYTSGANAEVKAIAEKAVEEAAAVEDGIVTIRVGGCSGDAAVIVGAAGGSAGPE